MKAIILNSGIGSRLGNLTKDIPKCLININDKETILSRQINLILSNDINDIMITTGPFEEKIRQMIKEKFPETAIKFVNNAKYKTTNYIYSLYLVKDWIDSDILLMHGDLVFDEEILKLLIDSKESNGVLVNSNIELPEKDFKAKIIEGTIKKIGIDEFGEECSFLAPMYKLKKDFFDLWMKEISNFINRGDVGVYAENALNNILDKLHLYPIYYTKGICSEIDDKKDLMNVRYELNKLYNITKVNK